MIKKINIKDFAIIDDINIDFNPGLTVITGETGSGKSIILEAISSLINGKFSVQNIMLALKNFVFVLIDVQSSSCLMCSFL